MSGAGTDARYVREAGPAGTRFAEIRRFAELDSTNRYLVDVARDAPHAGLVAVAEYQTAGRGRLDRRWEAPPGANLLASVLLVPSMPADQLHLCSVVVALTAADACHRAAAIDTEMKWPNDLMVGDRKLAGILAETVPLNTEGDARTASRAVVVGVGVNVGWPPADGEQSDHAVPAELRGRATSIRRETGGDVDPRRLLELLLEELEPRLVALDERDGRLSLAQEYRVRCSTLGQRVRVLLADDETVGTAMDITPEGHLLVDTGACFATITAGDVVHVRAGD